MSGQAGQEPAAVAGPGRYVVYERPDGEGLVLARTTDLCETCRACGCGEQADPAELPDFRAGQAHVLQWLMRNGGGGLLGNLRGLMRRG